MYSDDTLVAYFNGELDHDTSVRLETAVETDEDLERRLMSLDPIAAQVKDAFASVPMTARLDKIDVETPLVPAQRGRFFELAAAAAVAGVVGFGAASLLQADQEPSWQEQVANYQALYVADTVAPIKPTDQALTEQFARAEQILERGIDRESVSDLPGLTLKRAQILAFKDTPLVQVAFAAGDGTPFAFCIIKLDDRGEAEVTYETLFGLASAQWTRDGYGFMVIGGSDTKALIPISEKLSKVF